MLVPLPRLTGSLRPHHDVDQAYLRRKSLLQSLNSTRSNDDLELARKLVYRWEEASTEVRQAYKQLLGAVVELIDGEVESEEFQEIVKTLYNLYSNPGMGVDASKIHTEKKAELQRLVGCAIRDSSLQRISSLAHKLFTLQQNDHEVAVIPETAMDGYLEDNLEFGFSITFQAPSRFLLDVPLENGIAVTGASYTGCSLLQKEHDYYSKSASSQLDTNRRNVNLRWLKDTCDLIVKRGGSQLSGDELALALCRVLSSNKAGDEIAGEMLDLVGDVSFETVQDLVSHRKELVDAINRGRLVLKSEKLSSTQPKMPSYGTQVTIQTESERQVDKLRRKEEKRNRRGADYALDIIAESFSSLILASERKQPFEDLIGTGEGLRSSALPEGTQRFNYPDEYEEFRIPPTLTAPIRPDEKLVSVLVY